MHSLTINQPISQTSLYSTMINQADSLRGRFFNLVKSSAPAVTMKTTAVALAALVVTYVLYRLAIYGRVLAALEREKKTLNLATDEFVNQWTATYIAWLQATKSLTVDDPMILKRNIDTFLSQVSVAVKATDKFISSRNKFISIGKAVAIAGKFFGGTFDPKVYDAMVSNIVEIFEKQVAAVTIFKDLASGIQASLKLAIPSNSNLSEKMVAQITKQVVKPTWILTFSQDNLKILNASASERGLITYSVAEEPT